MQGVTPNSKYFNELNIDYNFYRSFPNKKLTIIPIINKLQIEQINNFDVEYSTDDLGDGFQLNISTNFPVSSLGLKALIIPQTFLRFSKEFDSFESAISQDPDMQKILTSQTFEGFHQLDNIFLNTLT